MIERWRRWTWSRYESRVSDSDNFAEFERLFSGPLTPDLASRMPGELLVERRGKVDQGTRKIIDSELMRRLNSRQPIITNVISAAALIISLIALAKAW